MNEMGNRIYQKRKEYCYTMEELGNLLGVNKTAVNKWEKGEVKNIKQSTIKKMADIFNCSPAWLMGLDDISPKPPKFEPIHLELIDMYSRLSQEEQNLILNTMKTFLNGHK